MNTNLCKLGWNKTFQQQLGLYKHTPGIPARIIREDRQRYRLHTGEHFVSAQLSGAYHHTVRSPLDLPTVGDWVLFEPNTSSGEGQIQALFQRKSLFTRQIAGKRSDTQRLAANIDYLFIVAGLDQEFNPKRIQRFLTQAWICGAEPVIVLNKSDLIDDAAVLVDELSRQVPGACIYALSAFEQESLECLSPYLLPGITVALSGASGVGKSSLINTLLGEPLLKTRENRADDNRGRHTTTWRELILLSSGACIIDLPGMRELQLTGTSVDVEKAYADIHSLTKACRFRNCQHAGEPGCAIESALQSGQLSELRYQQYLKLRNEAHNTRRPKQKNNRPPKNKPRQWEEKEAFFKEVKIQHRKNKKAQHKYHQEDGF